MEYFMKLPNIDLKTTFNCGQCFRWRGIEDYSHYGADSYEGIVGDKKTIVTQAKDGIILHNVEKNDIPYWENYFCADEDYIGLIGKFSQDSVMKAACEFTPGLRVLRQEPFETLISFIISQNNNIKRITCIIERLCEQFGTNNCFPVPETLARLKERDLTEIGTGYRARYIIDAAQKIMNGETRLDEIAEMSYNEAQAQLLKITGVGKKVADCVLLFGFNKKSAFPQDVWIKRVMAQYYPNGLPVCIEGYEGIAQQFLFHYIRSNTM
jgi:N-glycosylase/DNA lyase